MGIVRLVLATALLSTAAFGACNAKQKQALVTDSAAACTMMRRALNVMDNYSHRIKSYFGSGVNFPVYFSNPEFYKSRLRHRVKACDRGGIPMKCVGRCNTSRETVAYVLVTFGFVGSTIHFCDEHFTDHPELRAGTMAHEFGRLENIGDSEHFDTNNIYVWDSIVRQLSEDRNYFELIKP